jgi:hypothetical protein
VIIDTIRADEADNVQVNEARVAEAQDAELLLAILWASTPGILVLIDLSDPPESAVLNNIHQGLKWKLLLTGKKTQARADGQGNEEGEIEDVRSQRDAPLDFTLDPHLLDGDKTSNAASSGSPDRDNIRLRELSITTPGIVEIMRQVEEAHQLERASDSKKKLLLNIWATSRGNCSSRSAPRT